MDYLYISVTLLERFYFLSILDLLSLCTYHCSKVMPLLLLKNQICIYKSKIKLL